MDKHNPIWSGNNRGISLVEIIVIVLIIGIAASAITVSVGYAYSTNVSRTANELSDLLDLARTQSMSMVEGSIEVRIVRDTSNYYVKIYKTGDIEIASEELCSSSLSICCYDSPSGMFNIDTLTPLILRFDKSTGSFLTSYKEIKITSGTKESSLILVKDTGRNYVK